MLGTIATALTLVMGCNSNSLKATGVTISTVDAAMKGWAVYTQSGKGTDSQILTVSNAYVAYYNAGIVMSNTWADYVQNTNATVPVLAVQVWGQSGTNLINIVSEFTK